MAEGREAHGTTALDDGTVLVTGGLQAMGFRFHDTAEIFDPDVPSFTPTTGSLLEPRAFHAAVRLITGEVLLIGGTSGPTELATLEVYDPATQRFRRAEATLPRAASALAAVLLDDDRVLVTGGANAADGTLSDTAIYDPSSGELTPVSPMTTRRMAHALVVLDDGRVLAVGGWSDSTDPSATTSVLEVYDPASDGWEVLGAALARSRHDVVALRMPDCRVLVAGGKQVVADEGESSPTEVEVITVPHAVGP
jgi:hypothetical protein